VPEILLHHYQMSPYAKKVRLAFGLKGIAWRSVSIPIVMPKPDLTELTGGYRRTPVMQIGADIFCDTKLCVRVLERLFPEPSLFPNGDEATTWGLSQLGEASFMMAVTVLLGLGGTFDEAFLEDRKQMAPGVDFSRLPLVVPTKLLQLRANLDWFERQLADGRPYLLGESASLADLSGYHPHAFLYRHPTTAELFSTLRQVPAWLERVEAIGEGAFSDLDPKQAIDIAAAATPAPLVGEPEPLPPGLAVGDRVVVISEETGSGTVTGELLASGLHEIAVRRHSERAGEVVVHFPREQYLVLRAA